MGAWGEQPWENDTAADMFFRLKTLTVYEVVENGLLSSDPNEQVAAAWFFSKIGRNFVYDADHRDVHSRLAINCLKDILANKDWLDSWKDRTSKTATIRNILRQIVGSDFDPDPLSWYGERAKSLKEYAEKKNTTAMEAVVTELVLDAGRRAETK